MRWLGGLVPIAVQSIGDLTATQLRYIHPSQYELITHERHLNSLCSYPLCARPPAAPFKPGKRFRISTTNRSITEVEGNKEDGYCCKACAVRSRWVYDRLGEAGSVLARGKDWTIELVEDLDLPSRGDSGSPRATEGTASASRHETGDAKAASHTRHAAEPAGSLPAARRNKSDPPAKAEVAVPEDLMGDLQIHERPTSSTATPPSLIPTSPPPSNPSTKPTTLTPSKRAPNAILGEQSKLAQTVLKASKAINPEPQVNPDSEDEGEHAEVEWEREVGLDWGGGSEGEEDVWEAMKEAREMAEAADAHGR